MTVEKIYWDSDCFLAHLQSEKRQGRKVRWRFAKGWARGGAHRQFGPDACRSLMDAWRATLAERKG